MTTEEMICRKKPFVSFHTARIAASVVLLFSVVSAALRWTLFDANDALSLVLLVLAFAGFGAWFIITFVWCRCPHCGHRIIQKVWIVSECPLCKGALMDNRVSKGD